MKNEGDRSLSHNCYHATVPVLARWGWWTSYWLGFHFFVAGIVLLVFGGHELVLLRFSIGFMVVGFALIYMGLLGIDADRRRRRGDPQ